MPTCVGYRFNTDVMVVCNDSVKVIWLCSVNGDGYNSNNVYVNALVLILVYYHFYKKHSFTGTYMADDLLILRLIIKTKMYLTKKENV